MFLSEHGRLNDDGWSCSFICMGSIISPSMKCGSLGIGVVPDPLLLFQGLSLAPHDAT